MKLKVLQENLTKALNTTSRFTSSKVQLPVLANVLLNANKNKLVISGTNLENSISLSIGAKIDKEGDITIPARIISDLISNLNPGQISLETDKETLKISSQGFKSNISGMNSSDFPNTPKSLGKSSFQVPVDEFKTALAKVLFAASQDETRPILTGVLFKIKEGKLSLVATDGFRLSYKSLSLEKKMGTTFEESIIIPKGILSELMRIASDEEISISYKKDENQILFSIPDAILSSRIIEGEFPDFEKIIPKQSDLKVSIDKDEFLQAVKLASIFARDSANVVKISVKEDSIQVSAESQTSGSQKANVDAKVDRNKDFDDFVIAFNFRFLEDFLNAVNADDIKIELSDPNAPAVFLDTKDPDFLHIIMPVRI